MIYRIFIFISLVIFTLTGCYEEQQMISPINTSNVKLFGSAADINGNYAIIGAPNTQIGGYYLAGSAHIYQKEGEIWTEKQQLVASDVSSSAEFGSSVAISDNFAIVGAPSAVNNGTKSGAIYIYRNYGSEWILFQRFASPFNEGTCFFGESVDISGSYAIVGAPLADTSRDINTGVAVIFYFNGSYWWPQRTISASDGAYGDWFGFSVKLDVENAIVGAPYDNNQRGTNGGSAYIYSKSSGWAQRQKIMASGSTANAYAGHAVSIYGNYAIMGAPFESNERGAGAGAAYFYTFNGSSWQQIHRFVPPYAMDDQYFGRSVDIIDFMAAVGGPNSYHNAGLVHIYYMDSGTWMYLEELNGSHSVSADNPYFGSSIRLYGEFGIFGAPGNKDENEIETGTAYIFKQTQ